MDQDELDSDANPWFTFEVFSRVEIMQRLL